MAFCQQLRLLSESLAALDERARRDPDPDLYEGG